MLIRLFVFFGGLIVVALTAALVGPYFVDWTPYRSDFEREASRILGRKVTVEGTASARLLPFPSVTFSKIEVAGPDGGAPVMTADRFSMDAELAPFLRGEVLIFDMRVTRPKLSLSIDADGTLDLAIRPDVPVGARQITLEEVAIEDGEITLFHAASGREHHFTSINSRLSAKSLAGPWRSRGRMAVDDVPLAYEVSTGTVEDDGGMRLRLRLFPEKTAVAIESDGSANIENGSIGYEGRFTLADISGGNTQLRGSGGETFALTSDAPLETGDIYRISGRFHLGHKMLGIDEFRFETGERTDPYVAEGTGFVDLGENPRFAIQASGQQWLMKDGSEDGAATAKTIEERIAGLIGLIAQVPEPAIPGSIDLNLPAIVTGQTTIRDFHLRAEPEGKSWAVHNLSAKLPGRTTLEASGTLLTGAEPGFSGTMLLAVSQPSGFAAWLARDVDEAIRRLPAAGFSAKVDLAPENQAFRDLELVLGEARFTGLAEIRDPKDGTPSALVRLNGGVLEQQGLAALAAIFANENGPRHGDHDIEFHLDAGPVTIGRLTAQTVGTALRLKGKRIEIDKLTIGDIEGASVSATGHAEGGADGFTGNIDAAIIAVDLAPLADRLLEQYPDNTLIRALAGRLDIYPGLLQDARIDVVGSLAGPSKAGDQNAALSANGHAGGTEFTLTATGTPRALLDGSGQFSVNFTGTNDTGEAVLALFGVPVLPLEMTGALESAFSASGSFSDGVEAVASVSGEDAAVTVKSDIKETAAGGLTANGSFDVTARDLEPLLSISGLGYPGMGAGLPVELSGKFGVSGKTLQMPQFSGVISETPVTGKLAAIIDDGKPRLDGSLILKSIDIQQYALAVLGANAFDTADTVWAREPFSPRASVPATLNLQIRADAMHAGLASPLSDAEFRLQLDDGGLSVSSLEASYAGGKLQGGGELKNNGGSALLTAQAKISDAGSMFRQTGLSARTSISGTVSGSGKSMESLVSSLAGSGTAAFSEVTVPGLNTEALPSILREADKSDPAKIEALDVASIARPQIENGNVSLDNVSFPFLMAGGVMRTAPVTVPAKSADLTTELQFDLNTLELKLSGSALFEAGSEALIGSEPVVQFNIRGPLDALEGEFGIGGLKQYLTQRAFEQEQARVERMQAILLEKQRMRRLVRLFTHEEDLRVAERLRREEEARKAEEARRAAEEQLRAEEEARRQAEEEQRLADEEQRLADEEAERLKAEEERAARQAAEDAARKEEAEKQDKPEGDGLPDATEPSRAAEVPKRRQAEQLPGVELPGVRPLAPRDELQADNPGGNRRLSIGEFIRQLQSGQ